MVITIKYNHNNTHNDKIYHLSRWMVDWTFEILACLFLCFHTTAVMTVTIDTNTAGSQQPTVRMMMSFFSGRIAGVKN